MTRKSHLLSPAEDPQGDVIEAAIHALHANRPDVALKYLSQSMDARAYAFLTNIDQHLAATRAGESND